MANRIRYKVIIEIDTNMDKDLHTKFVSKECQKIFGKNFRSIERVAVTPREEKKE